MVLGHGNPCTERPGGAARPPLTSAVGEPVTYVQDPGLKVTGADSVRLSNSPITRVQVKSSCNGRVAGSDLHRSGKADGMQLRRGAARNTR